MFFAVRINILDQTKSAVNGCYASVPLTARCLRFKIFPVWKYCTLELSGWGNSVPKHEHYEPVYKTEFLEIMRGLVRLRRRLKPVVFEQLGEAKERFHKLLPRDAEWDRRDMDLFYQVGGVLIHQDHSMTMGELSQALDVPLSTTTRIIDHLVKSDYAQRLPDPADRRVVRVSLTDTGRELFEGLEQFMISRVEHVLGHFTPEEQATLLGLLRKLLTALNEDA